MRLEIKIALNLDMDDMAQAVKEWAKGRMPEIPGYHIEARVSSYSAVAELVKDKAPEEKEAE